MTNFVTPAPMPDAYERELLDLLGEECNEIGQRCSKATRLGATEVQLSQPHDNAYRLGLEVGDLLHVLDLLVKRGQVDPAAFAVGRRNKARQLARFMRHNPDGTWRVHQA